MPTIEVRPGSYWIGVNDRTTDLFEGLWPIAKEGISYNTYLVTGDQNVLIDLAKGFKTDEFLAQIAELIDPADLDYIVINHMEPDHTGILSVLRRIAPKATILGTKKTKEMLEAFYQITENVRTVEDGERLTLGSHTLQFLSTPFVHWPETMMTYEATHRILFSCDGFGGYGALQGAIFDDQSVDLTFYEQEALRYFVTVLAMFSRPVLQAITRLSEVDIEVIAPSHGLIWRKDPRRIVDLYRKWAGFARDEREMGVTLLYGSMYGNTEKMMNAVAQGISQAGVPVQIFDVARTHAAYILPSLWVQRGVIVGAPTYEGGLFPAMAQLLDAAARKRIVNRKAAYFGSYGWSGGAQKEFAQLADSLHWEVMDTFEFPGGPTAKDIEKGEQFGARFAKFINNT